MVVLIFTLIGQVYHEGFGKKTCTLKSFFVKDLNALTISNIQDSAPLLKMESSQI